MRIAVAADERDRRGRGAGRRSCASAATRPLLHGALADSERDDWAWASEAAARDVAEGRADQARGLLLDGHGRIDRGEQGAGRPRRAVRGRRRPPTARAAGTTPTCWPCPCAPPARRSSSEILDAWFAGAAQRRARRRGEHPPRRRDRVGRRARRGPAPGDRLPGPPSRSTLRRPRHPGAPAARRARPGRWLGRSSRRGDARSSGACGAGGRQSASGPRSSVKPGPSRSSVERPGSTHTCGMRGPRSTWSSSATLRTEPFGSTDRSMLCSATGRRSRS